MSQNVSCKNCTNGERAPKTDVTDSLNTTFQGYWCKAFRSVVHDYWCECQFFNSNPTKGEE